MSQSSQNSSSSISDPKVISNSTLLVEKLQETAQALLAYKQDLTTSSAHAASDLSPEKRPPEFRTYRIPGFMVDEEREMLKWYKADNWQEMFNKTYDQLYTMALLMQNFEAGEDVDGFSVQLMGNSLMVPLDMLSRLCSLVADFRPVKE